MAEAGYKGRSAGVRYALGMGRAIGPLVRRAGAVTALLLAVAVTTVDGRAQEIVVGDLVLEQPWARATPAGAKVAGGYLVIRNAGDTADRLVSGEVTFAERVEVHEMSLVDGVMTMRQLPGGLEIPPGGEVTLRPGSFHLMFVGLENPLVVDTPVTATLTFERAGTVDLTFDVAPIGAMKPDTAGTDHGAGHDTSHSDNHSGGGHTEGH
jgi:periplasmic copper chaperone A